jgi:hypothetical protein
LYKNSMGNDPFVMAETFKEVQACRKSNVMINTFMLASDHYLVDFVKQMSAMTNGKAYFANPNNLTQFVLMDFLKRRTSRVRWSAPQRCTMARVVKNCTWISLGFSDPFFWMNIASIVSSNSHIDYIARIIDAPGEDGPVPDASDHCFGQFVSVEGDTETVIGVIYDSRLLNPEYGSFGPRSGPRAEIGRKTADFVHEEGILIGILLLGTIDGSGKAFHGVPGKIVPAGRYVSKAGREIVNAFHKGAEGRVQLHYYPQVMTNARQFALPLLNTIIDQVSAECTDAEKDRLKVLRQSLVWQGTLGGVKL